MRSRLVLVCAAIVIALVAVEVGLRLARYGDVRPNEVTVGDWHPGLPDEDLPAFTGYRPQDFHAPRVAGVRRLAVVGDSFTWGVGVGPHETLPVALAAELAARGVAAEVFNLGIGGTNTQQQALIVRDMLPRLRPDTLLLVGLSNDAEAMPWQPDPVETCGLPLTVEDRLDHLLLTHLYALRPLHAALVGDDCVAPRRCGSGDGGFSAAHVRGRCFRSALRDIARTAHAFGADLVAFEYPFLPALDADPDALAGHAGDGRYGALLRASGIPVPEVRDAFVGTPIAALRLPHDSHPSGVAHQRIAARVADALQARWAAGDAVPVAPADPRLTAEDPSDFLLRRRLQFALVASAAAPVVLLVAALLRPRR